MNWAIVGIVQHSKRPTPRLAALLPLLLCVAGCGGGSGGAPAATASDGPAGSGHVVSLAQNISPAVEGPHDAPVSIREFFNVDVYQFTVPLGTLGRNEDFWKRIDEQCVDVATYDLLFKNGIRLGVAPIAEMDGIRKHIDADLTGRKLSVTGTVAKEVQLETRKDMVEQTIFHYDGANNAIGRSYDGCTNLINLSFEPTPRKPGSVRLKLCPMVRANRGRLEFSLLNTEQEIQYVSPEMMYDLNIRVDIPPASFLIITPSTDADRLTSVGHAFLTRDSEIERLEQVIVIVPRTMEMEEHFPLLGSPTPPGSK